MNENNKLITRILADEGIHDVGFCRLPKDEEGLCNAVSILVPLSRHIIGQIKTEPTFEYFHHYRTVNAFIDRVLLRVGLEIGRLGYSYLPIGASHSTSDLAGRFPHKTAARLAGLGYIGKNDLLISPKYGGAVRLGTILTDMPFEVNQDLIEDMCGDCRICASVCPAMAIRGNHWTGNREDLVDASACLNHMKTAYQHIGRGVVCGLCISKCPKI